MNNLEFPEKLKNENVKLDSDNKQYNFNYGLFKEKHTALSSGQELDTYLDLALL